MTHTEETMLYQSAAANLERLREDIAKLQADLFALRASVGHVCTKSATCEHAQFERSAQEPA